MLIVVIMFYCKIFISMVNNKGHTNNNISLKNYCVINTQFSESSHRYLKDYQFYLHRITSYVAAYLFALNLNEKI